MIQEWLVQNLKNIEKIYMIFRRKIYWNTPPA